jgi:hypothetical protein
VVLKCHSHYFWTDLSSMHARYFRPTWMYLRSLLFLQLRKVVVDIACIEERQRGFFYSTETRVVCKFVDKIERKKRSIRKRIAFFERCKYVSFSTGYASFSRLAFIHNHSEDETTKETSLIGKYLILLNLFKGSFLPLTI